MKIKLFLTLFLSLNYYLSAQELLFKEVELPEEMVITKIAQDKYGFLWLCSNKGLTLYNGYEFEEIGIGHKQVNAINTTQDLIWIGTADGEIYTYDWQYRDNPPKLITKFNTPIKDIVSYSKGLAIATYGEGLYKFQNGKITAIHTISSKEIYDLEVLGATQLAVATDRGIDIIDLEKYSIFENLKGLPDNIIVSLCSKKGELIAATYDSKLFSVNLKDKSITIIDENTKHEKYLGLQCLDNKILVHTNNEIAEWQNGEKTVFSKKQNESKLTSFFVDDENNLWIAQGKYALFKTNLFFLEYALKIKYEIQAMASVDKVFYLGTTNGIHLKKELFSPTFKILLPLENITVVKTYDGKLWIGTFSNGLYVYDIKANSMFHFGKVENIDDNTILDIEKTSNDRIEIATLSGIKSIDSKFYSKKKFGTVLSNIYSYDIFLDTNGNRWYGKDRNGITCISNKDTTEFRSIENSTDHKIYKLGSVYSIAENNGFVYFASTLAGLVQYQNKKWTIVPNTYKHNDPITSIVKQNEHTFLLIRSSRFDIIDLTDWHILPFINEKTKDVNSLYLNNYAVANGDVYFGYDKGITRFSNNLHVKKDPQIRIEKVEVNLEKVKDNDQVFGQDENNLRFTFIASWLTDPKLVSYNYKLDGFDGDWRKTNDRIVSYPKLPPGRYTFKVRASENGTFKNEKSAEYTFEIKQAYYNTWWFYVLMISGLGILLYWVQKRKKNEELLKAELAKTKIETELINLKSQLDPHFLFNTFNTLIGLIEEDPKKGVRFTEILTSFFRSLAELSNKELVTIEEELTMVANYRAILKERFGNNLQINIDENMKSINQSKIPPMSLQMLIENAVKHNEVSKARPLVISILYNNQYILVKNLKQTKYSTGHESLGIGNNNIIERYRLLGLAKPIIENESSSYTFYLPIVKNEKN